MKTGVYFMTFDAVCIVVQFCFLESITTWQSHCLVWWTQWWLWGISRCC